MSPVIFDMFSGCGGLSLGLNQAGFKIKWALENWDPAIKTFRLNHPETLIWSLVRNEETNRPSVGVNHTTIIKATVMCTTHFLSDDLFSTIPSMVNPPYFLAGFVHIIDHNRRH